MPPTPLDTTDSTDPLLVDETSALPALPQPTQLPTPEEEANTFADVLAAPVRGVEGVVRGVGDAVADTTKRSGEK